MLKSNIVKVKCIEGDTTQAKAAEIVGTTPSYVSRIINGGDKVVNKTLRKWLKTRNDLPAHKIGRQWKLRGSELDEWVSSGKSAID